MTYILGNCKKCLLVMQLQNEMRIYTDRSDAYNQNISHTCCRICQSHKEDSWTNAGQTENDELASQLNNWTLSKLNATLIPGTYQENENLNGENEELHWQLDIIEPKLNTIYFQPKSSDAVPKVLAEWWTSYKKPWSKKVWYTAYIIPDITWLNWC